MIRDRKYLDSLRHERCIVTGRRGTDQESVVPAHIGTAGKGLKSPDNEALPLHHAIHNAMHQSGEMTVLREHLPDDVLREALRALARERYAKGRWLGIGGWPMAQNRLSHVGTGRGDSSDVS